MTAGAMVRADIRSARIKAGTRTMRASTWRRMAGHLDNRNLAGLTTLEIEDWYRAGSVATPAQARQALACLSAAWQRAHLRGDAPPNACIGIRRKSLPRRERYLSPDEYARLGKALDAETETHEVAANLIRFVALTGLRGTEARTLRDRDVDMDAGLIRLADSKTGPRTAWLPAPAAVILERYRAARSNGCFFPARSGRRPIGYETVMRSWRRVCARAGLDDVRIHDLRHSYASAAVEAGVPAPVVQRLLGHGDIRSTMIYVHASPSAMAAGVAAVAEVAA